MMSAGVAFYALLSVFPALAALISIYGFIADRDDVQRELDLFAGILPAEAVQLLADQMNSLIHSPPARLGIGLVRCQPIGRPVERDERHDRFDAGAHRGV